jgi:pyridoxamine 5'-phosphate oxidase
VEFWQGQANRLHDRLAYRLAGGQWHIQRLNP